MSEPSRTLFPISDDPSPPPVVGRVCAACGRPLVGRRASAQVCSGRCRMALARGRRRDALTAALSELRQIKARLDTTIAVVEAELVHETRPSP